MGTKTPKERVLVYLRAKRDKLEMRIIETSEQAREEFYEAGGAE